MIFYAFQSLSELCFPFKGVTKASLWLTKKMIGEEIFTRYLKFQDPLFLTVLVKCGLALEIFTFVEIKGVIWKVGVTSIGPSMSSTKKFQFSLFFPQLNLNTRHF